MKKKKKQQRITLTQQPQYNTQQWQFNGRRFRQQSCYAVLRQDCHIVEVNHFSLNNLMLPMKIKHFYFEMQMLAQIVK